MTIKIEKYKPLSDFTKTKIELEEIWFSDTFLIPIFNIYDLEFKINQKKEYMIEILRNHLPDRNLVKTDEKKIFALDDKLIQETEKISKKILKKILLFGKKNKIENINFFDLNNIDILKPSDELSIFLITTIPYEYLEILLKYTDYKYKNEFKKRYLETDRKIIIDKLKTITTFLNKILYSKNWDKNKDIQEYILKLANNEGIFKITNLISSRNKEEKKEITKGYQLINKILKNKITTKKQLISDILINKIKEDEINIIDLKNIFYLFSI